MILHVRHVVSTLHCNFREGCIIETWILQHFSNMAATPIPVYTAGFAGDVLFHLPAQHFGFETVVRNNVVSLAMAVWSSAAFGTLFLPLIALCGKWYSRRHVLSSSVTPPSAARLRTCANKGRGLPVRDGSKKQCSFAIHGCLVECGLRHPISQINRPLQKAVLS